MWGAEQPVGAEGGREQQDLSLSTPSRTFWQSCRVGERGLIDETSVLFPPWTPVLFPVSPLLAWYHPLYQLPKFIT